MPIIPIKLFQMVKVLVYDALDSKTLILFRMVIKNLIPNKVSFIPYKLGYLITKNIRRITLSPLNYISLTQKFMKYKRLLENRFRWQTLFVDNKYGNDNARIIKL